MAKFAVLLWAPTPADPMAAPEDEMAGHEAFGGKVDELGAKILDGYALHASTEGKTVKGKKGEVVEGTFVDGTHAITGFFILEAEDLDQAVELAKTSPTTWRGGVEIRPLFEPPQG
ncbi:DGPFAETKE [Alloactinosynnema sp. L-07]|uniref:YciI family protein n=1 Tax=Alloactinosynnema sp. L-07 TaxID=1653480 RepID=UPI00065EF335|nr:YciI family protein [Alloactinosynnema sp. L-07]CRK59445.1 DGPFAETKE [Alloactinosynnema sp. L-07]